MSAETNLTPMIPTTTIYLRNRAFIYKPDKAVIDHLQKNYVYENPKYNPLVENSGPPYFRSFDLLLNGPVLIFDIGILTFDTFFAKMKIIDERFYKPFPFKVNLPETREYQEKAIEIMVKKPYGIMVGPCGCGKSILCASIASRLNNGNAGPFIVLVDELKLLRQWVENIRKFTSIKNVGEIGNGEFTISGNAVVATIQTLYKLDDRRWKQIERKFSAVFFDECQKVPSLSASTVVNKFHSRYKIAVSATPGRSDHMEVLTKNIFGDITHTIKDTDLKAAGKYVDFEVHRVFTGYRLYSKDFNQVMNAITTDPGRNQLIIDTILKLQDSLSIIITARVDHAKLLLNMCKKLKLKAELMIGEIDIDIKERIRTSSKANIIIGTIQLMSKGLDLPRIHNVLLAGTFSGNVYNLEQQVGRSRRPSKDKETSRIFDFIDKSELASKLWEKRLSWYTDHGAKII